MSFCRFFQSNRCSLAISAAALAMFATNQYAHSGNGAWERANYIVGAVAVDLLAAQFGYAIGKILDLVIEQNNARPGMPEV